MKVGFAHVFLALFLLLCAPAHGQAPARILVGFPPGGTSDSVARLLAEEMSRGLNRTVIVENRPGAGGVVAAMALKSAAPDGNTMMLAAIVNISIYPSVAQPPAYDPFRDFAAVALIGQYDLALAVKADGPRTVAEYIAWIRTHPDRANFGSPGNGSLPHLFGAQLASTTSIPLVHVPYQGAAPSVTNLLGGQIGAVIQPVSDLLQQHAAGKLRILATTGTQRNSQLPDVPTFAELGFRGLEGTGWIGLFVPASTPPATRNLLWEAARSAQSSPGVATRMRTLGFEVVPMTPDAFDALARRDAARWATVVGTSGVLKGNN